MKLIIETDLGHDPDDFFAICYLVAAGVDILALTVSPGDPDQIAIARLLCKELKLDIPVCASKLNRTKLSSGSIHHKLLEKYGHAKESKPDGLGIDFIGNIINKHPDVEFFVIGPVTSIGAYLGKHPETKISRATMQGGFLPYDLHSFCCERLEKFENAAWVPTFNLNGDRPNALNFLNANITERRMTGKNVCHSVLYNRSRFEQMHEPTNRAGELYEEAMKFYLEFHDEKKFHDPVAAVCHLHPEVGGWVRGKTVKMESGWTTQLDGNDLILADIDRDLFWHHIATLT